MLDYSTGRESRGKVVVLGAGNELLKDEGVGVHVARALIREKTNAPVEIIEAGTVLDCLPGDEPISKLVVVDAVHGGCEPGAIYRFTPEEMEPDANNATSIHNLGLHSSLKMSEITGIKPGETIIIGVEPKEIDWGTELSKEIQCRIPKVVELVLKEINYNAKQEKRTD
ncbi:HyaD/HybD family hydrogenase maturation endopeptidase [Chloroflexota bacterium]